MSIHILPVQRVGAFPVEYYRLDPETGTLTIIIWRDENRDDGFIFDAPDWFEGQEILRTMVTEWEPRNDEAR